MVYHEYFYLHKKFIVAIEIIMKTVLESIATFISKVLLVKKWLHHLDDVVYIF